MIPNNKNIPGASPLYTSKKKQTKKITLELPRIDDFLGEFSPSTVTLIDGHHSFRDDIITLLSVKAIDTLKHQILYIDGGNSINPYGIINIAKRNNLAPHHVLKHILVARAFTTYQLDTLIRALDREINNHCPSVLIVSCITSLLLDKNVKKNEGETLLEWWLQEITRVTMKYNLISLISSCIFYTNWYTHALWGILNRGVDTITRITCKKRQLILHLIKQDRVLNYLPTPLNQRILDEFRGGNKNG